jgi:hypothetical protein
MGFIEKAYDFNFLIFQISYYKQFLIKTYPIIKLNNPIQKPRNSPKTKKLIT